MSRPPYRPFAGTWIGEMKLNGCSIGVWNESGHPVRIDRAEMNNVDTAIYHPRPAGIDLSRLEIDGERVPSDLLDRFLEELKARDGDLSKPEDREPAAEASGLSKWLKDKGLDLAQVALGIAALVQG